MKIINLTPHTVYVIQERDGKMFRRSFFSKGEAHVSSMRDKAYDLMISMGHVDTGNDYQLVGESLPITVSYMILGKVTGLPDEEDGTVYIVSRIVKNAIPHRSDCLVPDDILRDEKGVIIGCRGFAL